jgi:holo-[acyl-carrier protein] synthase
VTLRTGVDIVDHASFSRRAERTKNDWKAAFLSETELRDVGDSIPRSAGRWAAKEAVMKALGRGIGAVDLRDIEVLVVEDLPTVELHRGALARAAELGLTEWSLSVSHTDNYTVAFVVAMGGTSL